LIGQTVSHYRILSKLGEGGMGTVYVAEDTLLGRRVAIKSLKIASVPGQKHFRTRFLREARAASRLNHPHIATVHDYGETDDGQPYLVMELIDGRSLSDLLREASLPVDRAVGIVKQVTEAIAEAHRHGIVHRDIKPSNVVLNQRNEVKVLDFGLAKHTEPDDAATLGVSATHTLEGVIIGTPSYLSPEQALGMTIDRRSDIFSIGAVLYECLTGTPAFSGKTLGEIVAQVIRDDPLPPSQVNPSVPAELGESPRMRDVFRVIERIAPTESTVLVRGESGTGKELVAHAIHTNSDRAAKAFVAINCAVLSETLLESELFGYEKGAFTGAVAQKRGRLEVADGGTLFLDEVGELTPATQAKLLRVLQEREFERVGGTRTIGVDVRIIAATNRNLEDAIKDGTFRQDLYYRLNVISLTLPPLRERREDIPLLAYYFAAKYSKKCKRLVSGISPETRNCLLAYDWPGNVREMENAIERAVVLGNSDVIVPDDLPESLLATSPAPQNLPNYHEAVNEMKKKFILQAIEQANGNYTAAAKLLGIHSTNLHRLIRTLGLRTSINETEGRIRST
jgi:DNA-binding NtrC family response regulator/predicted Ser/Thr protein kinase